MNRKRPLPTKFLTPKNFKREKSSSESAQRNKTICGRIENLIFPKTAELYTGFGVYVINREHVTGELPFIDRYFVYNLKCERRVHPRFGVSWAIVGFLDPPFEPAPISCQTLSVLARSELQLNRVEIHDNERQLAATLRSHLLDPQRIDIVRMMEILQPRPQWIVQLSYKTLLFSFEYIIMLQKIWPCTLLGKLGILRLADLVRTLPERLADFCFHWKNDFGLPQLTLKEIRTCYQIFKTERLSEEMANAIASYTKFKVRRDKLGRLDLKREEMWEIVTYSPGFCKQNDIIMQTHVGHAQPPRYFAAFLFCPRRQRKA